MVLPSTSKRDQRFGFATLVKVKFEAMPMLHFCVEYEKVEMAELKAKFMESVKRNIATITQVIVHFFKNYHRNS